MPIRIAINGAGRIGRIALRAALKEHQEVTVCAINDPFTDPKAFAYLFKYDTVHGKFDGDVEAKDDGVDIDGQCIKLLNVKNPKDIDWDSLKVDVVLECTGMFTSTEPDSAGGHNAGPNNKYVKLIIISAPAAEDIPTFVMGVNHHKFTKDMPIISNASCTTNCLAPILKVLQDNWGVENALMTTVHAATATQMTVDTQSKKDYRGGRSVFNNIIPTTSMSPHAVGLVIPELKGKIGGMSFRVPTADVSALDLTVQLAQPATYKDICAKMKEQSQGELKGILCYTEDDVVSSDFVGDCHTAIFDAKSGIALTDKFVKVVAFYDNEMGYASKLLDLAVYAMAQMGVQ